jgi:leucyl aminopeptidase
MLKMTKFVASGVQFAKDLVNAPPNSKTPLTIAACAQRIASEHGLECKILGRQLSNRNTYALIEKCNVSCDLFTFNR